MTSPVAYLAPEIATLARDVADRYAGTLTDVLRFAVPPRHARTERSVLAAVDKQQSGAHPERQAEPGESSPQWRDIPGGEALLRRLRAGEAPRAAWTHHGLPVLAREMILEAARATRSAGRGVVIVVPDVRDVDRLVPMLAEGLGEEVGRLVASDGPSVRARAHLRALMGLTHVVVGTRSAAWAPVQRLGLVLCWEDGEDSLVEQRAPYPHAPAVLAMRATGQQAAMLIGSVSRSVWAQHLVDTSWAVSLTAPREQIRRVRPRVSALDEADLARAGAPARIPTPAWRAIGAGLQSGPVLVQVPRAGYVPHLVCGRCREIARCASCSHALALPGGDAPPVCVHCGRAHPEWTCPECGNHRLRAMRVGANRTAEELGRAFAQTPVLVSEAERGVMGDVDTHPRLVVATPGAEPEAEGGYAAAVLLDAALATSLPGIGGGEEALRRWAHAVSLVRDGGQVVVCGGGDSRVAGALVRADPVTFADRELDERRELGFPPAVRAATLTGAVGPVQDLIGVIDLPQQGQVVGPFAAASPRGDQADEDVVRAVVRAPLSQGAALSHAIRAGLAIRSAHKRPGTVRVVVDPRDL